MNDNEKLEKYNINTKIIAKTLKEKQYTLERFSKLSNMDINILQEILKNNKKVPLYYLVKIGRLLNKIIYTFKKNKIVLSNTILFKQVIILFRRH